MSTACCIIPSFRQTKSWRLTQPWYINGKHNECENQQISQLQTIIPYKLEKTNDRFDTNTYNIMEVKNPYKCIDGFKYTENFDRKLTINGKTYYFNLKFVCGAGGSQTRTLRETYNFIRCQIMLNKSGVYFINILDGDACNKYIDIMKLLLKTKKNKKLIFIGDMYDFNNYFQELYIM